MKDFRDKIVLVTGAASGIGKATALGFAREGANLVVADVDEGGLERTAEEIRGVGRRALPVKTDVSRREEVEVLCRKALEEFGRVDVLMNNAGVGMACEIKDTDLSDWEWIVGINLWGPIFTLHYLLPHMVERKSGHVVNVASGAGLIGLPASGAYTTTKFGVVGLSEVLRTELERFHIGVTTVCPGVVRTPIFDRTKVKGFKQGITKMTDMKGNPFKGVTPEQAAKKILRAVKRNQAVLVFTAFATVLYNMKRVSPGLARITSRGMFNFFLKHKEGGSSGSAQGE